MLTKKRRRKGFFDSLIITIGGVRFRQCHCEKILEKYNKWQVNIPKKSSDLDGHVFLKFQLEGKTPKKFSAFFSAWARFWALANERKSGC